jgi:FlaA1/EpsC-like NDP-sugar epimerase
MRGLKKHKKLMLLILDIMLINLSYLTAFYFRFPLGIPEEHLSTYIRSAAIISFIYIGCFILFKLYESLWIYAGLNEFLLTVESCITANILVILYGQIFNRNIPYGVSILAGIFSVIYIIGLRVFYRVYRRIVIQLTSLNKKNFKRVMVIGAGSAGSMIIREMLRKPEMKYNPVALIDDSEFKQGTRVSGVRVLGKKEHIEKVAQEKAVEEIIIAIPSLNVSNKKELFEIANKTGCKVRTVPGIDELIEGTVALKQIRDVQVEDLLGRDSIKLDNEGISEYIAGKTILVTGGGGSIGSELCRQIVKFNPKQLLILDIYENNAYDLQNELKYNYPWLNLHVIIASVRDKKRLEMVFEEFRPEVVFHAAAHKHVPLMEDNPSEAIKNNVFGTFNTAKCADEFGVKRFVLISTDKAVNPTNIMGASKRMCEMVVQAIDKNSETEFVAVRFGNVLGSNGSVIPLFKKQIAKGGPVTLTNKYITRYFMTIPEASQLVLQAGAYAEGGEIFVLDMGKPVKIYDLACDLIRLSGFEPHKDIKIEITGLRPGEKLYEELLMAEEGLGNTKHEKIFVGRPTFTDMEALLKGFDEFRFIIENGSKEQLISKVEELVPTYRRTPNDGSEVKKVEEEVASSSLESNEGGVLSVS